jgi:hypothetical protein
MGRLERRNEPLLAGRQRQSIDDLAIGRRFEPHALVLVELGQDG